jgi:hypothetical protein
MMKSVLLSAVVFGAMSAMPVFAADPPPNHNAGGMREACAADFTTLCPDTQGQARMMCMQKNRDKASAGCKEAMAAMGQRPAGAMGAGGMGGGMPPGMGGGMPPAPKQ